MGANLVELYDYMQRRLLRANRGSVVHAFGFPMAYYAVLIGRLAGCRPA